MTTNLKSQVPGPAEAFLALKDQVNPKKWERAVATKETKQKILQTLRSSPNSEKPITIVSALSLLQEFKIVKSPHSLVMIDLVKRLIPTDARLTALGFLRLLFSMAENSPKITDEQRAKLHVAGRRLAEVSDRPMRTAEFLRLCEVMIERAPDETSA
jgi:hypothetical protein